MRPTVGTPVPLVGGASPYTASVTVGGTGRRGMLVFITQRRAATETLDAPTWNGQTGTLISPDWLPGDIRVNLFAFVDCAATTATLQFTSNANRRVACVAVPLSDLWAGGDPFRFLTTEADLAVQVNDIIADELLMAGGAGYDTAAAAITYTATGTAPVEILEARENEHSVVMASHAAAGTVDASFTVAGGTLDRSAIMAVAVRGSETITLDHFEITEEDGSPLGNFADGTPRNVRIVAIGSDSNPYTGFTGTVDVSSNGSLSAGEGTTAAFVAGVLEAHEVEFDTEATAITLSCVDTATGLITGESAEFNVTSAAVLTSFQIRSPVGGLLDDFVVDTPKSVRLRALDQNGNLLQSFTGTVELGASGATLSVGGGTTAAFVGGQLTMAVAFDAVAAAVAITAEDTATGLITGQSNQFDVVIVTGGGNIIGGDSALIS